ncbi:MAG: BlaI family transcriptional regulator, penicillinase repressor [Phycisphaerales bacterium]|jgi:BlaI family penicillinase repressor|nr:BlaI family transcriptional regulator, penicillinase repressor [Phycisphaerales bacterium]MEA2736549.1 BlaI family transcriptional regulator, penicillinase repressor [Humisphaera sp.]
MKIPRISDAEWQVMDVLWQRSPLTANEVVDELARNTDWEPATIKTMLNRLVKKGALKFKAEGKRYLYAPAVTRDACVRTEGRSFLDRVFGGAAGPLIAHFVEDAKLSKDEIAELRRLLERKGR